jgi:hypothetical protein
MNDFIWRSFRACFFLYLWTQHGRVAAFKSSFSRSSTTGTGSCHSSAALTTLSIPRGGGWFRNPQRQYRRLLNDQNTMLERQLRATQEDLLKSRKQFQALREQQANPSNKRLQEQERLYKEELKLFRHHITQLEVEITKLTKIKNQLEKMLQDEHEKVQQLLREMEKLRSSAISKEQYERDMAQIRREMEEQANRQLQQLRTMMEQRMAEAIEQAKEAAHREKLEAVQEMERQLTQRADKKLQEEQKKAELAVEREKIKMRKLIKALAERERKLFSADREKQAPMPKLKSTSSTQSQTTAPGTVRGPSK